jgi:hypothetical protein
VGADGIDCLRLRGRCSERRAAGLTMGLMAPSSAQVVSGGIAAIVMAQVVSIKHYKSTFLNNGCIAGWRADA